MEASVKSQQDFLLLTFSPRFAAAAAACINLVRLISPFESLVLLLLAIHEDVGVRMIPPRFDVMSFHLLESQQVVNLSPDSKAGEVKKWLISKGFSERLAGCPQCIYFPTEKKRQIILHTYHVYLVSVIHKAAYLTDIVIFFASPNHSLPFVNNLMPGSLRQHS